jgi:DNA-binding transcriptional LysR family regulator
MELSDLRIFVAVVDEGGILKASRALHRVPSNITTRIKQLEASTNSQLFYRHKQRLHLSPPGEQLFSYAVKLLRLADEATCALAGSVPSGMLRLGALESTTASRLPSVLAAYHKAFPEVKVELTTGTNDALTAAVLERRIDAAFVAEAPGGAELASLPLFTERLTLISAVGHAPVRKPQDLVRDSVIAFPNGCAYRRRLYRWLGDASGAATRTLDLASYHAIVACVGAGAGVALVPESVLETMPLAQVQRHALPRRHAHVVTPLIWRPKEQSIALGELVAQLRRPSKAPAAADAGRRSSRRRRTTDGAGES